ncbi:hypothetical protein F5X71_19110 [Nocardia brasiliensis]|uniref:Uncharacterized protein n=1 Tax=Nocardia brasiliensis TaxID=37326 RepID=A0A6G9XTC9_NOCBR|nr:hypothetical protein [Nocardia brasiliensis]QIS04158.1 hypothetical protein F5X71_19110 [Nocardia brasiliensis]
MTTSTTVEKPHQISTAASGPEEAPVVYWPEPSPLESWWTTVMKSTHPPRATG